MFFVDISALLYVVVCWFGHATYIVSVFKNLTSNARNTYAENQRRYFSFRLADPETICGVKFVQAIDNDV